MIGYIIGEIKYKSKSEAGYSEVVLLTGGVGYQLLVPSRSMEQVDNGDQVELFVATEVKEDAIDFYGFESIEEKELFKKIRGVHGIGPKSALSLMTFSVSELKNAIIEEDMKKLTSIKGLGKKSVERLILELKNKLPDSLQNEREHVSLNGEVMDALTNLGYRRNEIEKVLEHKPQELERSEDVIKFFLKNV